MEKEYGKYRSKRLIDSSKERIDSSNELIQRSLVLLDLLNKIENHPFYPELKSQMKNENEGGKAKN